MKVVKVSSLPNCDFCKIENEIKKEAQYDGATKFGKWAYMCSSHFKQYGKGLGTGKGQKLILESKEDSNEKEPGSKRA